jgi:two-component SAPR family response regulator
VTEVVLSRSGFSIATEQNCGKTMEKIKAFEPDLVLLDVNLSP